MSLAQNLSQKSRLLRFNKTTHLNNKNHFLPKRYLLIKINKMKKTTLLLTAAAGLAYVIMSSNSGGPAAAGANYTGAKGSVGSCSGCHTGSTAPTMGIRVDSAGGVQVTKYAAGMTYTVTVTGTHSVNNEFGFQFAAVTGIGASQVQAGTFGASLPAQTAKRTVSSIDIIEQSSPITGASNTFSKSFTWTAPATGTADVKMYLTVNAVDGNGSSGSGDHSANTMVTLPKHAATTAVAHVAHNINMKAYPNPTSTILNIETAGNGDYTAHVIDMAGRIVNITNLTATNGAASINTASWTPGTYRVVVSGNGASETATVVKQ
jgi:hypothetical protein